MATRKTDLHTVTMTLKDGTARVYRYHRRTRRRIFAEPGTPGFVAELRRAGNLQRGDKKPPITRQPEKRRATGFVYFVRAEGLDLVKIGWTTDVKRRLRAMQSGCPIELHLLAAIPAIPVDEARLHGQFAHLRHKREWFALTDEIATFLAQHGSPGAAPACPPQPPQR